MHLTRAILIGLFVAGVAPVARAQETPVDASRLPIDLAKITRELRQTAGSQSRSALHIRYTVDVYGAAPRIELFTKADNLATGPVPFGAPSHRQMIEHVTPIEYRAPIMDFSTLVRWLSERGNRK